MNQRKRIITVYLFAVSLIVLYWHSILAAEGAGPATSRFPCAQRDRNTICAGFWRSCGGRDDLLRLSRRGAAVAQDRRLYQSESGSDRRNQAGSRDRR